MESFPGIWTISQAYDQPVKANKRYEDQHFSCKVANTGCKQDHSVNQQVEEEQINLFVG